MSQLGCFIETVFVCVCYVYTLYGAIVHVGNLMKL